ncbi:aminotransferase class I/II-fold pyridoxal phosphate-dependent enzyme [Pedobacter sp. HDW13]|uniref:methionine aminotransferase n=1 Tax=unclassified Pedobacter TaxID=2628915 RepID=UPI000F5B757F|nr:MULTISPECIES: methionine aminotransferase [unclassified Pedobacter]QIL41844.1 aminotransferase class I/II-fold pyridoxal phosphate-dependent enzyme [Pedobacter sp. HDW13]RQO73376.1 methionine aminotransferase [Pedobacter sp. KBW01]
MLNIQSKLPGVSTTIFTVMSKLAAEHNAINLSQGFPDYACDPNLVELVTKAMQDGFNQYAPMPGLPVLKETIAAKVENLYKVKYNPDTEITVTAGGTQAIFTALAAIISAGDEVIIFEPAYDSYAPTIKLLGGLVKTYELAPPDYAIDWDMVKKLFTSRTRMIILNSPQNPTGSILSADDMKALIKLVTGTDILILSDEVYEHLIYDEQKHQSVMLYPELKQRSFIVASFGKLLHATGWKLGYCLAPEKLTKEFRKVHQFNVFSVNSPMQQAIATYLQTPTNYTGIAAFFQEKRDYFRSLLAESRLELLPCNGSYFQCVSYRNISDEKDTDFSMRLIKEFGVATIPVSAFYQKGTDHKIIRFCFAKEHETLALAAEKLKNI